MQHRRTQTRAPRPPLSIIAPNHQPYASLSTIAPPQQASFLELARPELAALDNVIRQRLSSNVVLIRQIAEYIISAGGKRLRPAMLMIMARALGNDSPVRHDLAAVVELIHTSTLLHDDVVDESTLRRGRKTANAVFGNSASVLVGDFLYSRSFQLMVSVDNMRVLQILADATNIIAEGEVLQLLNAHEPDVSVEDYIRVVRYKTATLFEASTRLGAVISNAPPEIEEACATYGQAVGTAFQIIDDVLDYEGSAEEMGKNVGDDLREGKPTMPLIVAMQKGTPKARELVRNAIVHGDTEHLPEIVQAVHAAGGIDASRAAARAEAQRGCDALAKLPASEFQKALLEFALQSIDRRA